MPSAMRSFQWALCPAARAFRPGACGSSGPPGRGSSCLALNWTDEKRCLEKSAKRIVLLFDVCFAHMKKEYIYIHRYDMYVYYEYIDVYHAYTYIYICLVLLVLCLNLLDVSETLTVARAIIIFLITILQGHVSVPKSQTSTCRKEFLTNSLCEFSQSQPISQTY